MPFDKDRTLIRHEPTELYVGKSKCGKYLTLDSGDLKMSLTETSLETLRDAFEAALAINWELYVMGDPNKMTQGALELREHLQKNYNLV